MFTVYLNAENWENCDVYLTEMDGKLWVACCCDSNYGVSYVNARELYKELKKYFKE